jgi:hypothetical protein
MTVLAEIVVVTFVVAAFVFVVFALSGSEAIGT